MSVGNQSGPGNSTGYPTCESPLLAENLFLTIYLVVVLVLTVFGNSLVIAVVFAYERLQQVTNYFIVSLAFADLLYATLALPFTIHQVMRNTVWCLNVTTCGVFLVVDVVCSCASICNLASISIDRLVAINSPFKYSQLISKTTTVIILVAVWSYSLLWGLLLLVNWTNPGEEHVMITQLGRPSGCFNRDPIYYTSAASLAFFVPLLVVITAYSIILKVAISQAKAVAALDPNRDRRKRTNFFREVKATKTIALVIGAFVVSWLPVFIILLLSTWDPMNIYAFVRNYPKIYKGIYWVFLRILPPLNSCINPIIYAVFNSNFRSAFFKFLHIRRRMAWEANNSVATTSSTRSPQKPTYSTMMTEKSTETPSE